MMRLSARRMCSRAAAGRRMSSLAAVAPESSPDRPPSQALLLPNVNLARFRESPLTFAGGRGVRVFDAQGREYLEAMAGLWCTSLGWGNEELVETVAEATRSLGHYRASNEMRVPTSDRLADELVARAPESSGLRQGGRVVFGLSGSDANDTQVRLLWHYNIVRGRPNKRKFVTLARGYHGCTVAAGSLTGMTFVHTQQGLPLGFAQRKVTSPCFYRYGLPGESEGDFVARLAAELEDAIVAEGGAEHVAAFFAEPVQGAGGVVLPPAGYFEAVGAVCAKHDVLVVADEVITGFGRTGHFWGADALGLRPDLVSSAKQITSAYAPLSAALLPGYMYDAFEEANTKHGGTFAATSAGTYSGHPVSCAVALKVLEIMDRDRIVETVRDKLEPVFLARLRRLAGHPLVGEARGIGLIGALELVADKVTREGFPSPIGPVVQQAALDRGLIVKAVKTPDAHEVICLCPPLIATPSEIEDIFDRVEAALDDALAAGAPVP